MFKFEEVLASIKSAYYGLRYPGIESVRGSRFLILNFRGAGGTLHLHGGPYDRKPYGVPGIKLEPASKDRDSAMIVDFPIPDFSTPTEHELNDALIEIIRYLKKGAVVMYVGCLGGRGRTGLVMACLVRLLQEAKGLRPDLNPIEVVREIYNSHAVETPEQERFVLNVDLSRALKEVTGK